MALADEREVLRAARMVAFKARIVDRPTAKRIATIPVPAIVRLKDGSFQVFGGRGPSGNHRLVGPITRIDRELPLDKLLTSVGQHLLLVGRRLGGEGTDPRTFSLSWFPPSLWRYRRPIVDVLLASLSCRSLRWSRRSASKWSSPRRR